MKKVSFILFIYLFLPINLQAGKTKIALLKYKGGDWYSATGAITNFLNEANRLTSLELSEKPEIVELRNRTKLFSHPFIILNGHGQILLDDIEKNNLKEYLENGGFLLVNDDYGLDTSFRR
ncbi:MAG: DUF4159 domain-containing protein, partial [Spirochaetota bacterium]|nr:DUF4159 domain-containing protein [Spirochaetota bacterium]